MINVFELQEEQKTSPQFQQLFFVVKPKDFPQFLQALEPALSFQGMPVSTTKQPSHTLVPISFPSLFGSFSFLSEQSSQTTLPQ